MTSEKVMRRLEEAKIKIRLTERKKKSYSYVWRRINGKL